MKTVEDVNASLKEQQWRSFEIREVDQDEDAREIRGIAVPWGELATLPGFSERMERGAVQDSDDAQLWWRHVEPIGKLVGNSDAEAGWDIRAKISKTPRGDEAYTLLRDGVVNKMSVGFQPVEWRTEETEDGIIVTHTKILVREVSVVPFPAYDGADVLSVRNKPEPERKVTPMPTETPAFAPQSDVLEIRQAIEDLERRYALSLSFNEDKPVVDTRSAGEILKAIVSGDQATITQYNELVERAYTGGVIADAITRPGWVGDLTRIIDEAAPLVSMFAKGTLPAEGMTVEFAQLKSNTVTVGEQLTEGADLPYGKVQIELKTAPVKTYGGWSELSFQAIQRSSINVLNTTLEAQAIASGKAMNAALRALFVAQHAAQTTATNVVTLTKTMAAATYQDYVNAIVDGAIAYDKLGLPMEGLVANTALFKALANMTANDGRPVLLIDGNGVNNVGTLNPSGLTASLANVRVVLDAGLPTTATGMGAFVNGRALRSYVGPLARLQDENIINLSKQFSVYNYAAFAPEIPAAIVPLKFA